MIVPTSVKVGYRRIIFKTLEAEMLRGFFLFPVLPFSYHVGMKNCLHPFFQNAAFLFSARSLCLGILGFFCIPFSAFGAEAPSNSLFRDSKLRDRVVAWERVADVAAAGQRVELLLNVLSWPHDAFERLPDGNFGSVRAWAVSQFKNLSPAELADYRQQWAARAADELRQLDDHENRELYLLKVCRSFPLLPEGQGAALEAARRLLEAGDFDLAARVGTVFFRETDDRKETSDHPDVLQKILLRLQPASFRSGSVPPATSNRNSAISQLMEWNRRLSLSLDAQGEPVRDWLSIRGSVSRSRKQPGSLPAPRSSWSLSLIERTPTELLGGYLDRWAMQQRDADRLANTSQYALIVGDQVLLRDSQGVVCLNLDGTRAWEWSSASSLGKLFQDLENVSGRKGMNLPTISSVIEPQEFVGANTLQGIMASDQRRLYLVDQLSFSSPRGAASQQFRQFGEARLVGRATNRLVALDLWAQNDAQRVAWAIGGKSSDTSTKDSPIATESITNDFDGHYFLGAPVITPSEMLVLTEFDRQIILNSIDPVTGQRLWKQPLAFADQLVSEERDRFFQACLPAVSGGIAVCPTRTGVIVAFDLATHQLLWHAREYEANAEVNGRFGNSASHRRGARGMLDGPLISGDRVVCLPDTSDFIRCFRLETGEVLWAKHRMDAEYIGAIDGQVVLVVGRQQTRGLSLNDGSELWKVNTGLPSGTGVLLGDRYVLPLDDGRFGTFEIGTGVYRTHNLQEDDSSLGNLIPAGDLVLSIGLKELKAFPQAQARLSALDRESQEAVSNNAERDLERAELEAVLGRADRVEAAVMLALRGSLSTVSRERAQRLLRSTLSQQLYEGKRSSKEILGLLRPLALSPSDRLHDVAWLSKISLDEGDRQTLEQALEILMNLPEEALTLAPGENVLQVSSTAWLQRLAEVISGTGESRTTLKSPALQAMLSECLDRWAPKATDAASIDFSRRWLAIAGEHTERAKVVAQLADRLMIQGDLHAAECLLKAEFTQNATAVNARHLSSLYELAGYPASARQIERQFSQTGDSLRKPLKNVALSAETSIKDANDQDDQEVRISVRNGQGLGSAQLEWNGLPASVNAPQYEVLKSPYLENRRRSFPPAGFPVDSLVTGDEQASRLMLFDKSTGGNSRWTTIEGRYSAPSAGSQAFYGHTATMAWPGGISLLSLLQQGDDGLVWKCRLPDRKGQSVTPAYGPAGASFLTIQSQQRLYMIDPATGLVTWRRDDLEPLSGLQADLSSGIFGDDRVLVVRGTDRLSYTLLETATGQKLETGRIEQELRQPSFLFGRKLFCVVSTREQGTWLRLWDPIGQQIQINEPAGERVLFNRIGEHEIALINAQKELKIYDVRGPVLKSTIPLSKGEFEGIVQIRGFVDRERYYVNFGRSMIVVTSLHHNNQMNDGYIPAIGLRDDLMAIDRQTGESLWVRAVPNRSVLNPPEMPDDLLVLASRVRDRDDGNLEWLLVEVLDARTGATLAIKDNIRLKFGIFLPDRNGGSSENDRLITSFHHVDQQKLTLYGVDKTIEIDYRRLKANASESLLPSR